MRHLSSSSRTSAGFTLIEIMVVLAIVASLIGAGSLMLSVAGKQKLIAATKGRINGLGAALEQLKSTDQLGRYPPTQISKLIMNGFDGSKFGGQPDATNIGIESLYVVFRLKGISVKPQGLDGEDCVANLDEDKALSAAGDMAKPDLYEYIDAWGNPIVYFSATDYKDPTKVEQYKLVNGTSVKVAPQRNATTGEFKRPDSYQLISLGPDQQPNTDDDILFGE